MNDERTTKIRYDEGRNDESVRERNFSVLWQAFRISYLNITLSDRNE